MRKSTNPNKEMGFRKTEEKIRINVANQAIDTGLPVGCPTCGNDQCYIIRFICPDCGKDVRPYDET